MGGCRGARARPLAAVPPDFAHAVLGPARARATQNACANPNVQPKPGMVRYRPVFQEYGVHVAVRVRAICQNGL